jgi:hypothetical protein
MNPYPPQPPAQNPYAPPQAPVMPAGYGGGVPMSARVEGTTLVVPNGAPFPPVCLKCSTTQAIEWRDQKFSYVPPWARFFGALIQLFVMKRSRFQLPVCQSCHREWKKWNLFLWLAVLPPIFICVLAGVVATAVGGDAGASAATVLIVIGILAFIAGLIVVAIFRKKKIVMATRIDKQFSWLLGVHANTIPAIVGGGYAAQTAPYGAPQGYPQGYPQGGGYPQPGGYPPPGYPPQGYGPR